MTLTFCWVCQRSVSLRIVHVVLLDHLLRFFIRFYKQTERPRRHCWKWKSVDLAKAFQKVQLKVVWVWARHFGFPQRILRVLCRYFQHQRKVIFQGCMADPLQTITAILSGSKWSGLLLRIVLQDALSEVVKAYIRPCSSRSLWTTSSSICGERIKD